MEQFIFSNKNIYIYTTLNFILYLLINIYYKQKF